MTRNEDGTDQKTYSVRETGTEGPHGTAEHEEETFERFLKIKNDSHGYSWSEIVSFYK